MTADERAEDFHRHVLTLSKVDKAFLATAIRSAEADARREALEEAVKVAEDPADWLPLPYQKRIADRIRRLASQEAP